MALDSSPTTIPSQPEPVGISTPAPPPIIATAVQTPNVQSLAPVPSATVEPAATLRETPVGGNGNGGNGNGNDHGKGNGKGHGNGHGQKKPK